MIITYLRSSSYGAHEQCQHRYMLEYAMGLKSPGTKKANMGTIVHKAMEVLAREKKAKQEGKGEYEDETFGIVQLRDITPDWATLMAYNYYVGTAEFSNCDWTQADLETCTEWTNAFVTINNGQYDPRKRNIIEAEQWFDFTIDKPWAHYDYVVNGQRVEGQLSLKGTMDLVVEDIPGMYEIIDYKTGKREDWAKNWKLPFTAHKKKTYKDLRRDPQLCLYHYASCHLFPQVEDIIMTIIFINDGGPFTLCFEKDDIELTEKIIEKKFNEIRATEQPFLNPSWKCKSFCSFSKGTHPENPDQNPCQFYRDKVYQIGIDQTIEKYGKKNAWGNYSTGGGRVHNE